MAISNRVPVITLDGPSGTGKGTICLLLSKKLGWHRLDSGVIYRALGYAAQQRQIDLTDSERLVALAAVLDLRFVENEQGEDVVLLDKKEVGPLLRSEEAGQLASRIAVIPEVRLALLERQRAFASPPGLVTDGRDMGTVVFPEAMLKIYLDASAEERAKRRYQQLKNQGNNVSLAQIVEEIEKRDARDKSRETAPLKPADDAVLVDTTGLSIVQVLDIVLKLTQEHCVLSS